MQEFNSQHPVVLIYSGREAMPWSAPMPAGIQTETLLLEQGSGLSGVLAGSLGTLAIAKQQSQAAGNALVMASHHLIDELIVEQVWKPGEWEELGFHELWRYVGGEGLARRDLWIDRAGRNGSMLSQFKQLSAGIAIKLTEQPLLPGVYALATHQLQSVPMIANNRAHSASPEFLEVAMRESRKAGLYRPFPAWFAHFVSSAPPNLYVQQRAQYEALFAARQRV
jgi:hypothetical protein